MLCHVVMLLAAYNTDWFIIHAPYRIISLTFYPARLPFRFLPVVGLFIVVQMQGRTHIQTATLKCITVGWLVGFYVFPIEFAYSLRHTSPRHPRARLSLPRSGVAAQCVTPAPITLPRAPSKLAGTAARCLDHDIRSMRTNIKSFSIFNIISKFNSNNIKLHLNCLHRTHNKKQLIRICQPVSTYCVRLD